MNTDTLEEFLGSFSRQIIEYSTSPQFYAQCGMILTAVILAYTLAALSKKYVPILKDAPKPGPLLAFRKKIYGLRDLIFPLFNVLALSAAVEISMATVQQSWLIRIAESLAVVFLIYNIISRFIKTQLIKSLVKWIVIPIAILQVFGWLDNVTGYLDTLDIQI
ncbi:MAG: mechanosensitive ion channel protein, partial [Gammaproteobacteria bacterium]|nr:mechanosensitive ion channel protein [Gammaproteobacteria bacterium]